MPTRSPIACALAHGAAAGAIVAVVALAWIWLPVAHGAALALATTGVIGTLTWIGAGLAARPRAANDNDPMVFASIHDDWRPVTDSSATLCGPPR